MTWRPTWSARRMCARACARWAARTWHSFSSAFRAASPSSSELRGAARRRRITAQPSTSMRNRWSSARSCSAARRWRSCAPDMANALSSEPSAYLQSAAHQPVHWLPWGDAAFARAREEHKPILLDIGAVWCHWCHVMDGESYEDPAIAEILNRDFVCIKVDRDERPDVDARYQRAVQALSVHGSWPLTAFLTPDGEVFFGGTYFPPDNNSYGRPGFHRVLLEIARAFREEPDRVTTNARAIKDHVVQSLNEAKPGVVSAALVTSGADQMARLFDVRYGGFGNAPKFPHPPRPRVFL